MWPPKIQAQVVIYRTFYVFAINNIYQGINCRIFFVLACVTKSAMNFYFEHSVTQSDPNSYCAIKMGMNAGSVVLPFKAHQHLRPCSHRMEVNSFEFLVLFYICFSKDFSEVNQNCRKMLTFHESKELPRIGFCVSVK